MNLVRIEFSRFMSVPIFNKTFLFHIVTTIICIYIYLSIVLFQTASARIGILLKFDCCVSECIRDVGTMSVGVEREARSIALEKAYVHQVYQQISSQYQENHKSRSWPRIKQFLEDLEPGSLVCDVGKISHLLKNDVL